MWDFVRAVIMLLILIMVAHELEKPRFFCNEKHIERIKEIRKGAE